MKLSVSNIAWGPESDAAMYPVLAEKGYQGLEAAPTRLFPQRPYDHLEQAAAFRARLQADYGLCIPSIQSIWYGRTEELFSGAEARAALLDYTQAAIRFAAALGCGNLVFGSPKNRARSPCLRCSASSLRPHRARRSSASRAVSPRRRSVPSSASSSLGRFSCHALI